MSNIASTSHLEALPAELFKQVLSYVYNPYDCEVEESNTKFGGYHFETSFLRVNKGTHQLAKSYMHHGLSWIRFDLNWGAFAIQPYWLGVSYINVRHVKANKALSDRFLDLRLRSVPQQAPAGRLHIKMQLPRASNEAQEEMACMVKKDANVSMSLLVLEKDLAAFMKVLRMNDLAYCHRKLPETLIHESLHAIRGVHGIKSEILVSPGQQRQRYEHLILEFRAMNNPLHKTVVVGHPDKDFAKKSVDLIQGQLHERARKALGLSKAKMNDRLSMETHGEAVSSLLWLKHRGDEYLAKGLYSNAYMCYSSACTLEKHCLAMSPPPPNFNFWTTQSCLYVTFGVTLVYNMAIAKMKGGLDFIPPKFRGTSIRGFYGVLAIISNGGRLLDN